MVTAGNGTVDTNCGASMVINVGTSKNFRHNFPTKNPPNVNVEIINAIQMHLYCTDQYGIRENKHRVYLFIP